MPVKELAREIGATLASNGTNCANIDDHNSYNSRQFDALNLDFYVGLAEYKG
jgi:hypothetical protein